MIEDIESSIKTQREEMIRYAVRYATSNDPVDRTEFQKHEYTLNILISLLPK
jgi:hypothetical protein